jgi:hypothetical protein
MSNLNELKVGDKVRYTSPNGDAQNNPNDRWIWEGTVERVTWKYSYVRWETANSPVFGGPLTEHYHRYLSAYTRLDNTSDFARNIEHIN